MAEPTRTDVETAALLDAAGIVVTEDGRARARAKLDLAAARMDDERWAQLRKRWLPGHVA